MPRQKDKKRQEFWLELLSEKDLTHPSNEDERIRCWEKVSKYIVKLYGFYSANVETSWLSQEIEKYYVPEQIGHDIEDLEQSSMVLWHVYQSLDLLSTFRPGVAQSGGSDGDDANVDEASHDGDTDPSSLYRNDQFMAYVTAVCDDALQSVGAIKKDIDTRRKNISYATTIAARDQLERTMAVFLDAHEDITRRQKDLENTQKAIEKSINNRTSRAERKVHKLLDDAQNQADGVLTNVLTILGIFVAIIVAFISGFFSILISLQSEISYLPQIRLAHFLLMGQVVLNLIFVFMFMVARLSDKSICISCLHCTNPKSPNICRLCATQCSWLQRILRKYPYCVIANMSCVVGYMVLFIWWYADVFCYSWFCAQVKEHPVWILVGMCGILVAFIILCVVIFCMGYKKSKKRKRQRTGKL